MSELSPGAKALLEAARRAPCAPSEAAVERMEHGVMAAVAVSAAAGIGGAAAVKSVWSAVMVKVVIGGALLIVGGVVGAALFSRPSAPAQVELPVTVAPTRVEAPALTPLEVEVPAPVAPSPVRVVRREPKPAPLVVPPAPPPSLIPTSGELAMLRAAMEHVDASEWKAALAELEVHDAKFPASALRDEADVLRVLALCGLDQVAPALEVAAKLRARSPSSPGLNRLTTSCVNP